MDHFIQFEWFYQHQFFISLDQTLFQMVDPKINRFGITFHNLPAYLLKFI